MNILNKKAQVGEGLMFLLKLLLFIFIAGSAVYIFNNVALSDIKAQNAVRNLGVSFDSLALSSRDATLEVECPAGVVFTIEGPRITAVVSSTLGKGFASYGYMHESNAILPTKKILDCSLAGKLEISKRFDASLTPTIAAVASAGGGE